MRHVALGGLLFFLVIGTARADWIEASSDHFVIYSDQQEKTVHAFAERLERFHAAMAYLFHAQQARPSPSNHMGQRALMSVAIDGSVLAIGPIALRKLRRAEADMMPITIESRVGVSREEALELVPKARKVAERHPNDPRVLAALAEAEFDAGNDDAAIAAADRALAIDPNQINVHIQKGYALARKVESGALPAEAWRDVRAQFILANKIENDHPIPLIWFYFTYVKHGEPPTKNAIAGLEWALRLAPFDTSLRWLVAEQMVTDRRLKEAVQTLSPLAYSPHPGKHTEKALKLLEDIEAQLELDGREGAAMDSREGE